MGRLSLTAALLALWLAPTSTRAQPPPGAGDATVEREAVPEVQVEVEVEVEVEDEDEDEPYDGHEEMPDSLAPPDPPALLVALPSWRETRSGALGIELDAGLTSGSFVEGGGAWLGASAAVSLHFQLGRSDSESPFDALFFDGAGLGVRAHVLSRVDDAAHDGSGGVVAMIGGGITLTNRVAGTALRVPTLLGAILPETGAVFRSDGPTSAYFGWALPLSLLVAEHLALDVRPRVLLTFPEAGAAGQADVFVGVSVGLVAAQLGAELPPLRPGSWLPL